MSPLLATQRTPAAQGPELPLFPCSLLPSDPGQWNIDDVYEFISSLPGGFCLNCYSDFYSLPNVLQALTTVKLLNSIRNYVKTLSIFTTGPA